MQLFGDGGRTEQTAAWGIFWQGESYSTATVILRYCITCPTVLYCSTRAVYCLSSGVHVNHQAPPRLVDNQMYYALTAPGVECLCYKLCVKLPLTQIDEVGKPIPGFVRREFAVLPMAFSNSFHWFGQCFVCLSVCFCCCCCSCRMTVRSLIRTIPWPRRC